MAKKSTSKAKASKSILTPKSLEFLKNYLNNPFVAQTAYAMTGDKERLLESGFDDYISKPLNQNRLISTINSNLRKFKKY